MRSIKTRQKNKLINELEFKNYKKIVPAVNEMSAISVTDLEGKIIFINEKFKKLSGYSKKELIGKTHKLINSNTHSKLFFKNLWSQLKSGNVWVGQLKNISRKGDIYWLQSYISPIKDNKGKIKSYFAIQFEITDQKLVEEALAKENAKNIHLTRLATLGEMAAGIAHEINNPLAIIDGFVGSAQNRLRGGKNLEEEIPRIIDNLSKVKKQVERITKIISGLMAFSSAEDRQNFNINNLGDIVKAVEVFCLERAKSMGINFKTNIQDVSFKCSAIQMEQAFLNLINNSLDAVSALEERWIYIESFLEGDFIKIQITDSGGGIPGSVADKIMEPFFTTKEVGKGTGLGLSIAKGIVEGHGGEIYLNDKSKNTQFVITLPLNDKALFEILDFEHAISTHIDWKQKLINQASKREKTHLDFKIISEPHNCSLGKWILKVNSHFENNIYFKKLKEDHQKFHVCAGEIAKNINISPKKIESLLKEGSEYDQLSKKIIANLQRLIEENGFKKIKKSKRKKL